MARLVWDAEGEHFYENGVDQGVLYPYNQTTGKYTPGVVWNGLSSVAENPEGAEPNDIYADNIKYLSIMSAETYGITIEAYQSPVEFDECDGSAAAAAGVIIGQQTRKMFGFVWRSKIGNDINDDLGYKYHLVWGCKASPSEKTFETVNDSPEAATLSWEVNTTPVKLEGFKPFSKMTIDSRTANPTKLQTLLDKLYGTDASAGSEGTDPELPSPDYIVNTIFA